MLTFCRARDKFRIGLHIRHVSLKAKWLTGILTFMFVLQEHLFRCTKIFAKGVTLAQLVKASVGQADVQRFEPHLGHN